MILLILKALAIVVTFCVVIAAIIIGIETRRLNTRLIREFIGPLPESKKKPGTPPSPAKALPPLKQEARRLWTQAARLLDSGRKEELQSAVLALDVLCDEYLKEWGYGGQTMGDRLKEATLDRFPSIQRLWTAHRTRNRIVHEPGKVSEDELKEAIGWYGTVLRDWRLIE